MGSNSTIAKAFGFSTAEDDRVATRCERKNKKKASGRAERSPTSRPGGGSSNPLIKIDVLIYSTPYDRYPTYKYVYPSGGVVTSGRIASSNKSMLLTIEVETNLVISIITLLVVLFKVHIWIRAIPVPQCRSRRDNDRREHSGRRNQTQPVRRHG
jgi:hypothetical protein